MTWLDGHCEKLGDRIAIIDQAGSFTYADLAQQISLYKEQLDSKVAPSSTVAVVSDYNFNSIALFIALLKHKTIVVPIVTSTNEEVEDRINIARCDVSITLSSEGALAIRTRQRSGDYELIANLISQKRSGLILFSSGSTGKPKAMVHDLDTLVDSYQGRKIKKLNFLVFLMFDHIGGINTLLNGLAMGAVLVIPHTRDPNEIGKLIETHKVNVLPSSPTFLNLLLIHQVVDRYDFSKLKMITYGTEPMPESLLKRLREKLPRVRFLQTFGTSETGIAQTASRSSDSLEMKISDPNTEYKIVNGELLLKSSTQVLGYLNASMERFSEDGWFHTGDLVEETEDGYLRILGRNKEIINVGGEKVLPSEVESLLLELDVVLDAVVKGKPNAITGQSVVAEVVIKNGITDTEAKKLIRQYCKEKVAPFKVPSKIIISDQPRFGERYKKMRLTA